MTPSIVAIRHLVAVLLATVGAIPAVAEDPSTGTFSGAILLEGKVPPPRVIANLPGGVVVRDETLVVDPKTAGVANVVVFLSKPPAGVNIPPAPATPATVRIDNSKFVPHVLGVRVGQPVTVTNVDLNVENWHSQPIRNPAVNKLVASAAFIEFAYNTPERLPVKAVSDIHPWMQHYQLVVDHPWFAITDTQGRFTIDDLPPGQHAFDFWHERVGYLERKYPVAIVPGAILGVTEIYDAERFLKPAGRR